MGILCLCQQGSNMFKSLLATALVAAVKAEADPFYGYYGALPYAHGYAYAGVPFGSSTRLAWTPSPRALMSPPRDTFPMPMVSTDTISATTDTTTARGLLMLRLTPTTLVAMLLLGFPLDTLPAWTPSPRALMPPPRVTFPMAMPTATSATTDTILATSATTTVKFRELTRHVC